jgi:isopenicillin N synthase-like dioxygenase
LKPHADGSGYTVILQDDVEGLQILKDEQWFTVPTISDAFLVLMGDQMEVYMVHLFINWYGRVRVSLVRVEGSNPIN